jgi:hypothetical protein
LIRRDAPDVATDSQNSTPAGQTGVYVFDVARIDVARIDVAWVDVAWVDLAWVGVE